jgi:hypothetical protein
LALSLNVATCATKPRIALGSTTLIVIGQFYKLLKTFVEVVFTLIGSNGCQPWILSKSTLNFGSSKSNM